jgi:hypothetical protein
MTGPLALGKFRVPFSAGFNLPLSVAGSFILLRVTTACILGLSRWGNLPAVRPMLGSRCRHQVVDLGSRLRCLFHQLPIKGL